MSWWKAGASGMVLLACATPVPPEWQKLGLPLEASTCKVTLVNDGDPKNLSVVCPGKAADWQAKYASLTSAGWVETGLKTSSTHLIEKGGVAIDWTVQQGTDTNVTIALDLRTARP